MESIRATGLPYTYYETIAGGHGASPQSQGASGHHAHMTNSLNTPVEALEYAYPFRMIQYAIRRNSGGAGKYPGGDGIVRELELLGDAQVTFLADRRKTQPWGLAGGGPGLKAKPQSSATTAKRDSPANARGNSNPATAFASNPPAAAPGENSQSRKIICVSS